jgi:peptidoglycan hydrolase CwlO-like protein
MSKVKKMKAQVEDAVKVITKEELENVKNLQTELQKYCNSIGSMEVQKAKAIYQVNMLEKDMDEAKKSIEEKYGPININLVDGSYEEVVAPKE